MYRLAEPRWYWLKAVPQEGPEAHRESPLVGRPLRERETPSILAAPEVRRMLGIIAAVAGAQRDTPATAVTVQAITSPVQRPERAVAVAVAVEAPLVMVQAVAVASAY